MSANLTNAASLPSRKAIRSWMIDSPRVGMPSVLRRIVVDWMLFITAISGTVLVRPVSVKGLLGLLAGFAISRLFILGHDACHHTLTHNRD